MTSIEWTITLNRTPRIGPGEPKMSFGTGMTLSSITSKGKSIPGGIGTVRAVR